MPSAKTRVSKRAQLQHGDAVLSSCSFHALWARRGDDGPTGTVTHQVDARPWDEGGQLCEPCQGRESHPRRAVRSRGRAGGDEGAVGVLCLALQGHGTACHIPDQALPLIPLVGGALGVSVPSAPVDAGTVGAAAGGPLAFRTTPRAETADLLAGPFATGEALRHRGRHGTGEIRCVINQRILSRGPGGVEGRFQGRELPQCADDAPADLLDYVGAGGVRR